ncbi:Y-family DNA polymerase [Synechococcus sp. PCC 7335]|uniref:Y-family DNA polymerase n=1 Tax=Synechococcus sp. (strain ATCC 29403 / PCC 7335) TaxID=91464 RepID=UPI00056DC094|nr:Y-family DNA polymerase [Synechococcus sp. PCC 7335]
MPIFALCDCNQFYVSCERVFRPELEHRACGVLSSNDGCFIARSPKLKALEVPMGGPWHKYKKICAQHNVAVFSSNYALYGDMSQRVMACLGTFTPDMEVYSIDEAFLQLDGFAHLDLTDYGRQMQKKVHQWTGIPIGVGIGPTKTLAKVANYVAKKRTTSGVFNLCDRTLQDEVLPTIAVGNIWGIGRRWTLKLNAIGIETAADLRAAEPRTIRQVFNVVAERIVHELRGTACLGLEEIQPKKNIMCSRSFGRMIAEKHLLLEAIADHAARAAGKLRRQGSRCGGLQVFLQTNRFRQHEAQYSNSCTWSFTVPSSDSREIIHAARACMAQLYRPEFEYHKCGVMLFDLAPATTVQGNLFCSTDHEQSDELMALMDSLNAKMGRGTVRFAAQGLEKGKQRKSWGMRQQWRSPRYTTRLKEIVKVRC